MAAKAHVFKMSKTHTRALRLKEPLECLELLQGHNHFQLKCWFVCFWDMISRCTWLFWPPKAGLYLLSATTTTWLATQVFNSSILVWFSFAVIDTMTQSNLMEEGLFEFLLPGPSPLLNEVRAEMQAGTKSESTKELCLVACSLAPAQLASFLIQPCLERALPKVGQPLPHQSSREAQKDMANLIETILQLRLRLPRLCDWQRLTMVGGKCGKSDVSISKEKGEG